MMLLSLPILYWVDMAKGRRDAEAYEDGPGGGLVAEGAGGSEDEDENGWLGV